MKSLLLTLTMALALTVSALAYNVTGRVLDENGEPMIKATVRVLHVNDSSAVKGALTDDKGQYRITDVPNGHFLLETSYVGYSPIYKDINVKGQNLKVEDISLAENTEMLRDITVTGIKTPIKVMEDTIEFNADSYRTQPNAVVEDLLKRLPGVEVGSDGSITANGKSVTKILVDGKEFFGDDPTVASKNLPVDMIDKLQVVDRKSDLARMTGVDDGEDETVINLTVKKGMNNGWFGNAEAGYGTDSRYSSNFNINRFYDGNQITLLGGANNTNSMGMMDGGGRFGRFGGFGGITKSQMLGLNFNIGNEELFRVGGDVSYMHTDRDVINNTSRQNLFPNTKTYENSDRTSNDRGHNLRSNFRVEWKPDSFNTLDFRPNFRLNVNDSWSNTYGNAYNGFLDSDVYGDPINKSLNSQKSHGFGYDFGGRLIYNHNFKQRKGRSFSISGNYSFSNQREKSNTYSWNQFFNAEDPYTIYDQFTNNHTWSNSVNARASWTEPLGDVKKGNFMELSYQFTYRWNNGDKLVYNRPLDHILTEPLIPEHILDKLFGDELIDRNSNRFRNNYMNQDIRLGFRHVDSKTNLNVGLSLVPQMNQSIDLINDDKSIPRRNVLNYAPFLRYRLKMTKQRSLNIDYRGRSSQPSLSQLQPVADTTDPLNIITGNPDLDPSFRHNIGLRFQDFNMESQRSIMLMVNGSMTQNAIVQRTIYNMNTGGRESSYVNVNGIWNIGGFSMISFPLKNKSFTLNNSLMAMYDHNVGFTAENTSAAGFLRNNSGDFRIRESFGIAWRPDYIEIELRPNYSLQYTSNSVQTSANKTVHGFGGTVYGSFFTNFGLSFNTDLTYTANRGYSDGFNKNEWMWNASLSYSALKDQSLTFTLRASDILEQRTNINRTVSANYIQDSLTNTLGRYVMLSVSYRFNSFGKGNEPQMRDGMFGPFGRGPMGPPPGGGRPGGGPGGGPGRH